MNALRAALLAGLCVLLAGCPAILGSLIKSNDPSFLQASRGKGDSIRVEWAAPSFDEDEDGPAPAAETVDHYNVYRDGTFYHATTGTSYVDNAADPGVEYSYYVDAEMDDGSMTGSSNSDTGWYVPAEDLAWDGTGVANHSDSGWFETVVVEGWTYRMTLNSTTVTVHDHQHPSSHLDEQTTGTWTWTATETGRVWIGLDGETDVTAWHD